MWKSVSLVEIILVVILLSKKKNEYEKKEQTIVLVQSLTDCGYERNTVKVIC